MQPKMAIYQLRRKLNAKYQNKLATGQEFNTEAELVKTCRNIERQIEDLEDAYPRQQQTRTTNSSSNAGRRSNTTSSTTSASTSSTRRTGLKVDWDKVPAKYHHLPALTGDKMIRVRDKKLCNRCREPSHFASDKANCPIGKHIINSSDISISST